VRAVPLIAIMFGASLIDSADPSGWLEGDKLLRVDPRLRHFLRRLPGGSCCAAGSRRSTRARSKRRRRSGMRAWQYQITILIPQAFRITMPQTVNQAVAGFKDTSYVAIVGFFDMTASASAALGTGDWALAFVEVYIVVGLLYFVFAYSLSRYGAYLERRMAAGYRN
jgi:general L-amino acid transport system permease protein